ncbi:MAG TPA: PrsW family glutamic-type intramembrane protease [Lacipirellula sp.]
MTWRHYLQIKTRTPAFLWRMAIGILLAGVAMGIGVDMATPAPPPVEPPGDEQVVDEPFAVDQPSLEQLAEEARWLDLWMAIPAEMFAGWRHWGMTAIAILTGACWTAFLMQAIQIRSRSDYRAWTPLIGLGLGVLSIWPTLFLIYWQQWRWGLAPSEELRDGMRYFLLGVGLREELAKFVCFLPLLPVLVRRRDELAALITAGCVGVGFAMEENVGYIAQTAGVNTLGRLLSAAPLHMSMTALVGLAAYRACVWPRQCLPQLVAIFVVIAVAHGMYDAVIVIPELADFSLAASLILIGVIYQFFRELRSLAAVRRDPISLTANFLFCVCTVAAATFVYVSSLAGWQLAMDALMLGVITQAIMVYLFLREMPETMVSV